MSFGAAVILGVLALSCAAWAQTATIQGVISSFDVVNDTGQDAHGFEVQIEGGQQNDLYYVGYGQQYGSATVVPYATGIYLRWMSAYDATTQHYAHTTPPYVLGTSMSWQNCYPGGVGYPTVGCEHFGQMLRSTATITKITGRWLVENPDGSGTLVPADPPAPIPFGYWNVAPVVTVSTPPVVVAEVEAPEPPETPETYGDAQWVKTYKTQLNRPVTVEELLSTNPAVVPEDPAQIEVAWDILQASPPSGGNGGRNRTRTRNQGGIDADTRAVVRRYENYKYTGAYDVITHKVACADGTCTAPSAGELGDFVSAQNTAVNVVPDVLVVGRIGNGVVSGANGKINCGNACAAFALNGTTVSLTENPSAVCQSK